MRAPRALAALALVFALAASAACRPSSSRPFDDARPTTTVATTTTSTTTAPPPAPVRRASRSAPRPRLAPQPFDDCAGWGTRTRGQSDACWLPYVAQWSDWNHGTALRIIWCESKGNPWAKNPHSSAANLFQILGASVGDGPANIALAHDIWTRRGWSPWVCR